MTKMTDRELIRLALIDASAWQHTLADANGIDTVAGKAAANKARLYREMYERKYGKPPAADQRRAFAEAKVVKVL